MMGERILDRLAINALNLLKHLMRQAAKGPRRSRSNISREVQGKSAVVAEHVQRFTVRILRRPAA